MENEDAAQEEVAREPARPAAWLLLFALVLAGAGWAGWMVWTKHQFALERLAEIEPRHARLVGIQQREAELTAEVTEASQRLSELVYSHTVERQAAGNDAQQRATRHTLVTVLESLLRLMHPIMPFITETIWQSVKPLANITADSIMLQAYPQVDTSLINDNAAADIEWVKSFIVAIRNIRGEMDIAPTKPLPLLLRNMSAEDSRRLEQNQALLLNLAKLDSITVLTTETAPACAAQLLGSMDLLIPMAGLIDKTAELTRIAKQLEKMQQEAARVAGKLANEGFVAKAPEAVLAKEREKLAEAEAAIAKLLAQQAEIAAL